MSRRPDWLSCAGHAHRACALGRPTRAATPTGRSRLGRRPDPPVRRAGHGAVRGARRPAARPPRGQGVAAGRGRSRAGPGHPRGAAGRRRAHGPPPGRAVRVFGLLRSPLVHGLHHRSGDRPRGRGRHAGVGRQHERRWVATGPRRDRDRAGPAAVVRRAVRPSPDRGRLADLRRGHGELHRAEDRPRRQGLVGCSARGRRRGAPDDAVRLGGGPRGHGPRRGHARPRGGGGSEDPGGRRLPHADRRAPPGHRPRPPGGDRAVRRGGHGRHRHHRGRRCPRRDRRRV